MIDGDQEQQGAPQPVAQEGPSRPPRDGRRPGREARGRRRLIKTTQLLWLITGVAEGVLGIRVLLRLAGAYPGAGFARFISWVSAPFMAPFAGLVPVRPMAGEVLEVPVLVAMAVYLLAAWVVIRLIWIIFYKSPAG